MLKLYHKAASKVSDEQLIASTSYVYLDKGKAKDPAEFPSGHVAQLAAPTEHPDGEHDADDEDKQLVSRPSRTNSNQTLSCPASQCSSLNQCSSGTRQSSSLSNTSQESGLPRSNAVPDPPALPSHASCPSPSSSSSTSRASRDSGAPNRGP